jgi:hypothetical protein
MTMAAHRPKNWLLLRLRSYHGRVGMTALLLLVLLALTGVYLNHPDLFGLDPVPPDRGELLTTSTDSAPLVALRKALEAARAEWGEAPVQFVQLREEGARLVYRVRRRGSSDEVTVDARTGRLVAVRGDLQEVRYTADGRPQSAQFSWTRVMFDLHTGRILGGPGRLIADAAGLAVLLLATSGVYLFAIPRWRRWRTRVRAWPPRRETCSESAVRTVPKNPGRACG